MYRIYIHYHYGWIDNRGRVWILEICSKKLEESPQGHVLSSHQDDFLCLFHSVGSLRTLYDTGECPCALFHSTKTLLLWMRGSMLLGILSVSHGSSASTSHWRIRNLSCIMLYPDWTPKRNSPFVMFFICIYVVDWVKLRTRCP